MKSLLLFAAVCTAALAVSATATPFHPPVVPSFHPWHPLFPSHGGSAPSPSSSAGGDFGPSLPSPGDVTKCLKAAYDSGSLSCSPRNYDAGNCCTYLTVLGDSCHYVPYFKSSSFNGIVKYVCDGGSASPPAPSS